MPTALTHILSHVHLPAFAALVMLNLAACDRMQVKDSGQKGGGPSAAAAAPRIQQACASQSAYGRLKDLVFDEAIRIRNADPANLKTLASHSVLRMEKVRVQWQNDTSDETVCRGHVILDLPSGAEGGFNGAKSLEADVEYTARAGASGVTYQMAGAEAVSYKLAVFDLMGHTYDPPAGEEEKFAEDNAPQAVSGGPQAALALAAAPASPAAAVLPSSSGKRAVETAHSRAAHPARTEVRMPSRGAAEADAAPARADTVMASALPARSPEPPVPPRSDERAAAAAKEAVSAAVPSPPATALATPPPAALSPQPGSCRHMRNNGEYIACRNAKLTSLDRSVEALYDSALMEADSEARELLRRTRKRFRSYLDRCRTEACVAGTYQGRMEEIADIVSGRYIVRSR